jgi:hypothetical protein
MYNSPTGVVSLFSSSAERYWLGSAEEVAFLKLPSSWMMVPMKKVLVLLLLDEGLQEVDTTPQIFDGCIETGEAELDSFKEEFADWFEEGNRGWRRRPMLRKLVVFGACEVGKEIQKHAKDSG